MEWRPIGTNSRVSVIGQGTWQMDRAAHAVAVVAYSPLATGQMPLPGSPGGRVLQEVARTHCAMARQVALRFLVRHPNVLVIPKQARLVHVQENAAATGLGLSAEEVSRLDAAFPAGVACPASSRGS